jgi:DNA modification methylase
MSNWSLIEGDALDSLREMDAESVHCCITSPPYFGLRDYGTGTWEGGDPGCQHRVGGQVQDSKAPGAITTGVRPGVDASRCKDCGATRIDRQIGLESTPDEYVVKLVEVFREVKRVLRDDGTLWLNLGDSYAGSWGAQSRGQSASSQVSASTMSAQQIAAHPRGQTHLGTIPAGADYKAKDLLGIPWLVAFALRADGWYLRSEIIWCLSGGARVYARTQKGDMPMAVKELVRLDPATVKLWNGEKWTQALGWSASVGRDGALELELRSGERIGCTPGHEWPTQRGNVRADKLLAGDVLNTTELPQPETPDTPSALDDARVGWIAGRYLADGSMHNDRITLACHADEADDLAQVAGDFARSLHGSAVAHRTRGKAAVVAVNGPLSAAVIRAYVYGDSAHTKGIRSRAWRRSNAFLRALLDGYLSGDGHYEAANHRWRLGFTRNDRLAADLRTLAARLGCSLTLRATTGTGFGRSWPIYRGELRFARSGHHNEKPRSEVVAIRPGRGRQFWDIGVADEPHLFALASGVLTHNSKPNPMPESVTDRPTKAHETVFLLSKSPRYYYDGDGIKEPQSPESLADSFRRRPSDRSNGVAPDRGGGDSGLRSNGVWMDGTRNKRSVWTVATQPYPEAHFATFPPKLIEPMILAGCPRDCCGVCGAPWERDVDVTYENPGNRTTNGPRSTARKHLEYGSAGYEQRLEKRVETTGWRATCAHDDRSGIGVALDPFAGSGTTLQVAVANGRSAIGIELNPEYVALAERRLVGVTPSMFDAVG